jgi:hypothetical protein
MGHGTIVLARACPRGYNTALPHRGAVAQLGEHHVRNVGVEGSNPFCSTINFFVQRGTSRRDWYGLRKPRRTISVRRASASSKLRTCFSIRRSRTPKEPETSSPSERLRSLASQSSDRTRNPRAAATAIQAASPGPKSSPISVAWMCSRSVRSRIFNHDQSQAGTNPRRTPNSNSFPDWDWSREIRKGGPQEVGPLDLGKVV